MCLYVWLMISHPEDIHNKQNLDPDRNQKVAFEKSIPWVIRIVLEVFPEKYWPLISWNNVKAVSQLIFNPVKRPSPKHVCEFKDMRRTQVILRIQPIKTSGAKKMTSNLMIETSINLNIASERRYERLITQCEPVNDGTLQTLGVVRSGTARAFLELFGAHE